VALMPLLNYTTTVPSLRTVTQITELLAKSGAAQILIEYSGDASVSSIGFAMQGPHGLMRYRLPVNVSAVWAVMERDRSVARRFKTQEQAERVAWRIMKDWIEAQLAIVATRMVSLDQVMLPYMLMDEHTTVYDLYVSQQLNQLGPG
jgi:hypothetical protein